MNRLLLDTHIFIWFVSNDENLPVSTREKIESAEDVFLSGDTTINPRLRIQSDCL